MTVYTVLYCTVLYMVRYGGPPYSHMAPTSSLSLGIDALRPSEAAYSTADSVRPEGRHDTYQSPPEQNGRYVRGATGSSSYLDMDSLPLQNPTPFYWLHGQGSHSMGAREEYEDCQFNIHRPL